MSWSYSKSGNAEDVAIHAEQAAKENKLNTEPEEAIRQLCFQIVAQSVDEWKPGTNIEVSMWGSQSTDMANGVQTNSLTISIKPGAVS